MSFWIRNGLLCLLALVAQAAFAAEPTADRQNKEQAGEEGRNFQATIPVFFATDRRQEAPALVFKEQVTENIDYLNFGVINEKIKVKNFHQENKLNSCSYSRLSSEESTSSKPVFFPKMPDDGTFDFAQLAEKMKESKGKDKGVIVHVHGCCMGFSHAAVDAALTSAWLDTPVVLYDWGSPFGAYAGSLQACERSQQRFNKFMGQLTKEVAPEKITIVGFSLGNQLIVDYLLQTDEKRRFKDLILTRPDLDLVTFQSHLPKISPKANQIHLYFARNDIALHFSSGLRKLVSPWSTSKRLGTSKNGFAQYENITVLDVSKIDGLHTIPNAVMADMQKNHGVIPQNSDRFKYTLAENGVFEVSRLGK